MSHPTLSIPRLSHAVSRRCAQRCFFLRPSKKTNQLFGFCLGVMLQKHPTVRLTCFAVLSNHVHYVVSDDEGDLSSFFRDLNGLLARSMNCCLGRGESFWAPGGPRPVGIFDEEALWEQLVYATVNPTKDGLVRTPEEWPGLLSLPEDVGTRTFRFERPSKFFRSEGEGSLPEVVEFQLEQPVELEAMDPEAFRHEYRRRLDAKVAEVQRTFAEAGRGFMGPQLVRDQNPYEAAGDTFPDRDDTPTVACKDRRLHQAVLRWISEFRLAYRMAWVLWASGLRETLFPFGTYWMRVKYGVRCRDPVQCLPVAHAAAA